MGQPVVIYSPPVYPFKSAMSEQTIQTISEFLLHGNANYVLIDMGRDLQEIDSQTFLDIENGILPLPRPRQQHGWFGIVFWHGNIKQQHYIWFLKLPTDEQGLLIQASRNHFLQIIVDALGSSVIEGAQKQDKLPDNPYTFVPSQSQMAQFSALVKQKLSIDSGSSVKAAMDFFKAPTVVDWRQLSYQNLADCATQCDDANIADVVFSNLIQWPKDVALPFLNACESVQLCDEVLAKLISAARALPQDAEDMRLAYMRAVALPHHHPLTYSYLHARLLENDNFSLDELSVFAGRHYTQMDTPLLLAFFEKVAETDSNGQYQWALFKGFFSDLGQIPALREQVLGLLRSPDRSELLSKAIGSLFNAGDKL